MAYNSAHILLRFHGHFGTSGAVADRWSAGLRFGLGGTDVPYDVPKLQTFVNDANIAANGVMIAAGINAGTGTFYDYAAGARVGLNGKYDPSGQLTVLSPSSPAPGSGTNSILPWNTAHVVSLRTTTPRGRTSNGRFYWPACGLGVAPATGRVTSASVASRLGSMKTFLDTLNTLANAYAPGMRLRVFSNIGLGGSALVTGIRSDDRLDSIERRENDQPSSWTSLSLA
jgi:hypothetical protein